MSILFLKFVPNNSFQIMSGNAVFSPAAAQCGIARGRIARGPLLKKRISFSADGGRLGTGRSPELLNPRCGGLRCALQSVESPVR
jgi:hypothetical protein